MEKIKAVLISGKVSSNSAEAGALFEKSTFGERDADTFIYMMEEAYFLVEQGKMDIFSMSYKKMNKDAVLRKMVRIDKDFLTKYVIFRDLRNKGYIVKSALKFGADFRVYPKGESVVKSHAAWICFCVSEKHQFKWVDFAAKNRVAHSTKKNLLIGVVDQENDVSYYEVLWKKLV